MLLSGSTVELPTFLKVRQQLTWFAAEFTCRRITLPWLRTAQNAPWSYTRLRYQIEQTCHHSRTPALKVAHADMP
eukprot:3044260-Amphidinium_carterae.1